jgi:hypothetical protein
MDAHVWVDLDGGAGRVRVSFEGVRKLNTLAMRSRTMRWGAGAIIAVAAVSAAADGDVDYARRLALRVNEYRTSEHVAPLAVDATIAELAREHSAAMAKAGRMSHDDFPSRVRRSGLAVCVENVGWNYRSAEEQFNGWRSSPGHDHNMLDRRVERTGVAVVAGYVTMLACGR